MITRTTTVLFISLLLGSLEAAAKGAECWHSMPWKRYLIFTIRAGQNRRAAPRCRRTGINSARVFNPALKGGT